MISGTGMRPGDIVTASNGKTIEVISSFEGFLVKECRE
jgi:leucyl aminopeptidase